MCELVSKVVYCNASSIVSVWPQQYFKMTEEQQGSGFALARVGVGKDGIKRGMKNRCGESRVPQL